LLGNENDDCDNCAEEKGKCDVERARCDVLQEQLNGRDSQLTALYVNVAAM